jgi:hypothetical protein
MILFGTYILFGSYIIGFHDLMTHLSSVNASVKLFAIECK